MVIYKTNTKNFSEKVVPYLKKIELKKIIDRGCYEFMISVKNNGTVECCYDKELGYKNQNLIYLSTEMCSKTIEDKLKILTNY